MATDVKRVEAGDVAPHFALPDETGNTVRLADFRGQTVVLYMYPKNNTPGCTQQACDLRDHWGRVQATGAVVFGLSPDSVASHAKFKEKHGLPFPLLADEDKITAQAYGAWVEKSMFGRKYWGVERSTFIINGEGRLHAVMRKVRVKGHVDAVLDELAKLA